MGNEVHLTRVGYLNKQINSNTQVNVSTIVLFLMVKSLYQTSISLAQEAPNGEEGPTITCQAP